jgi:hypothetical protein
MSDPVLEMSQGLESLNVHPPVDIWLPYRLNDKCISSSTTNYVHQILEKKRPSGG